MTNDTNAWARAMERAIAEVDREIHRQNEAFSAGLRDWGGDEDFARFDEVTRFSPGRACRAHAPTRGLRRA
jgi:hypothetical protein